jgi:DNA processing protein
MHDVDPGEVDAWLRLVTTPRVGRAAARRLLAAFGSAEAIFAASPAARRAVAGESLGSALSHPPPSHAALVARTLDWLAAAPPGSPRALIPLGDPRYPDLLLEAGDPPLLLHAEGRHDLLQASAVAMVGSRHATPQGLAHATDFAGQLAAAGHTIVSGLAAGVDGAAHEGALPHAASTVAVVGTGLDQVYPRPHAALAERIRHAGLIVSEYPLGTEPRPAHFPQRNRIIAGMSRGTLVVEAALASGSLITARLAAEGGREVFAIPGSIHSPQSRGCHALLKQGAKLVETVEDVLEEIGGAVAHRAPRAAPAPSGDRDPILAALGHDPVGLDTLVSRTGEPAQVLTARLLELEIEGRIARLPGQRFQRLASP